jgi:pyruvate/2-oxoglutarate dehydrogenase complex dihydrolipoamide dehydrogenase (E3) component
VVLELQGGLRLTGSHLLAATGRAPNTEDLGLATVGLRTDKRGYIETNGKVAANLAGGDRSADGRVTAYAMFTDPPLGHIGLYERDARKLVGEGRRISQAVFRMADVSRAKEEGELSGLVRLLVDEDSGLFLGASILGIQADEIVQVIGLVMAAGGTWRDVRDALPIHPTVTEFLPTILDRRRPLSA